MTKKWIFVGTLAAVLVLAGVALAEGSSAIDWWVIGGGGGSAWADRSSLDGTIGQWVVGSGTSGTRQLGSGFWGGGAVPEVAEHGLYLPMVLHQG